VRLSKRDFLASVKSDLPFTFSKEQISAHAGLELFRLYFRSIDLAGRLRRAFQGLSVQGDYGPVRVVLCLIALLLVGGRRITHLRVLDHDPVFLRFTGLKRLPSDRTIVRWLKVLQSPIVERLATLVRDLAYEAIVRCGFSRLTVDVDGTVLRTGVQVEGAARGFNPHHPKDKSYYPLTAHLAQTGQILRVWNRPGNVHDSHGAKEFLRVVLGELRARFGHRCRIEVRLDGAFCQPWMFPFLDGEGVEYAVKLPLWEWLPELRAAIARRKRWTPVTATVSGFSMQLTIGKWNLRKRVVLYRKHVSHKTQKNFQLDLFSPNDGHYEYSAVATNKTTCVPALWHFMGGRGGHEKTLSELKQHLAFGVIPTQDRLANSVWQQISVLTHNLVRSFQLCLGVRARPNSWKRTCRYIFQSLQTLRFTLIQQPARIVQPAGRRELRFAVSPTTRRRIERAEKKLLQAA
jgi:hypothetical protein